MTLCSGRILAISCPEKLLFVHRKLDQNLSICRRSSSCFRRKNLQFESRWRCMASSMASSSSSDSDPSPFVSAIDSSSSPSSDVNSTAFCIIEGPETVQDFAKMELQEIQDNIRSRRNKIFLHMEEVRRLRIQQRIKSTELGILNEEQENELPNFPSFIPFLPPLNAANLRQYYATCFSLIAGIILFGGLLAPTLELKLGLGGTSYMDFIRNMHLPMQLSQVDPIVASFSGGAVGVISALMVVEVNNVKLQEQKRCKYCLGTGMLYKFSLCRSMVKIPVTKECFRENTDIKSMKMMELLIFFIISWALQSRKLIIHLLYTSLSRGALSDFIDNKPLL